MVAPTCTQGWAPSTSGNPYQGLHEFSQRFPGQMSLRKRGRKLQVRRGYFFGFWFFCQEWGTDSQSHYFADCLRGCRKRPSQKALKRREPQSHEDTKFFPGLSELRLADKKIVLCAFVVQGFYAFYDESWC